MYEKAGEAEEAAKLEVPQGTEVNEDLLGYYENLLDHKPKRFLEMTIEA